MLRAFLAALLIAPATTAIGGPPNQPSGPPPKVMILTVERDGTQYITHTVAVERQAPRVEAVKVGDKVVQRVVMVKVPVVEQQRVALDGKGVEVFDHAGKRIAPKDVPRFLKSMPVLVSADGKPVDPFYLRLVREGMLIVVAPALASSPGAPIMPAVPVNSPPPPKKLPRDN